MRVCLKKELKSFPHMKINMCLRILFILELSLSYKREATFSAWSYGNAALLGFGLFLAAAPAISPSYSLWVAQAIEVCHTLHFNCFVLLLCCFETRSHVFWDSL